jgi:hypothetical protein
MSFETHPDKNENPEPPSRAVASAGSRVDGVELAGFGNDWIAPSIDDVRVAEGCRCFCSPPDRLDVNEGNEYEDDERRRLRLKAATASGVDNFLAGRLEEYGAVLASVVAEKVPETKGEAVGRATICTKTATRNRRTRSLPMIAILELLAGKVDEWTTLRG